MSVLIVGKIPPPIGGVTIHVFRLIEHLRAQNFPFDFLVLNKINLLKLIYLIRSYKVIHLHTSNVYIQVFVVILCRLWRKKSIVTFHGDLNRYKIFKNTLVKFVIYYCHCPIVLNEESLITAKEINSETLLVSSFLPPLTRESLEENILYDINVFKRKKKKIFATNAYSLTYDKEGEEIYGIFDLIRVFNGARKDYGLVFSDPSSRYSEYIKEKCIHINEENILIINGPHSFYEVLKLADASIRNTSTDGDSLSVRESLSLGKITFATNVVSRPTGVFEYQRGDYNVFFQNINLSTTNPHEYSIERFIKLYKKFED